MSELGGARLSKAGYTSDKAGRFVESVIREMSRVALAHDAINLAQGFPDFPAPVEVKQAGARAIADDYNQYAITWGARALREAIAWKAARDYEAVLDPETQITVCCGATEGMIAALFAVIDPGDEVIVIEPFYENYGPDIILCGAAPKYIRLRPPDFSLDYEETAAAFSDRTKAIILNSPHNPSGKVFTRAELTFLADLCQKYDALVLTDEIYEHILYDKADHIPIWTLPGMAARTIAVNSISKTFSVTGWRIGYVIAPPIITGAVRKVHDFLTVGAPAPLQIAAAQALHFGAEYYQSLAAFYAERRDYLLGALTETGFECVRPAGAYYIMADFSHLGWDGDLAFARYLATEIGVAAVPGSSFYRPGSPDGRKYVRLCFCKKLETLAAAVSRLKKLRSAV